MPVSRFANDNHVYFEFHARDCFVNSQGNSSTFSSQNANLWHHRLGHANSKAVFSVIQLCNIACNNKSSLDFCDSCCIGKSHKLHAPYTNTVYSMPFELVHTDL
jgi:histone deacetylase 1/2